MQRPSGQEYSGQGTLVPLGPPGAVIPSEGKGRENRPGVRTALHPPPALASIRGLASLPQPSSSLPWEQADSPSQSCSRFRHTWEAKPQEKRPPPGRLGGACGPQKSVLLSPWASNPLSAEGLQGEPKAPGGEGKQEAEPTMNLKLAQKRLWEGSRRGRPTWAGARACGQRPLLPGTGGPDMKG